MKVFCFVYDVFCFVDCVTHLSALVFKSLHAQASLLYSLYHDSEEHCARRRATNTVLGGTDEKVTRHIHLNFTQGYGSFSPFLLRKHHHATTIDSSRRREVVFSATALQSLQYSSTTSSVISVLLFPIATFDVLAGSVDPVPSIRFHRSYCIATPTNRWC